MTETKTTPEATVATDWDAQFAALKGRFPKVRDTILFAFHVLQSNPVIALDDLKAQANLHGVRVTASTVSAARRLLARNPATEGLSASPRQGPAPHKRPRTRQRRAPQAPLNVEALIRKTVAKVQEQGAVEAERRRVAIRKAIALLEAALGD